MPFGQERQAKDGGEQPRDGTYQSLIMNIRRQLEKLYAAVLVHRALTGLIFVSLMILCLWYVEWETFRERLLAWMRWHYWGYPA